MIEQDLGPCFRRMPRLLDAREPYRPFGFAEPDGTYTERAGTNAKTVSERGDR